MYYLYELIFEKSCIFAIGHYINSKQKKMLIMNKYILKISEFIKEMKTKSVEYTQNVQVINEDKTYKNRKRAESQVKTYCKDLKNENDVIDRVTFVKQMIPNYRLAEWKFLPGLCRMVYCEELEQEQMDIINEILYYLSENPNLIQNYNGDFNGLYFEELWSEFEEKIKLMYEKEKWEMSQINFTPTKHYSIIPIHSQSDAEKYYKDTEWCIAKSDFDFQTYTLRNESFYFCLVDNYKEYEKKKGKNHPLDEYGLSMLAISVKPDGRLASCTTRWNEASERNKIMNAMEISKTIGANFYEVFKPF